MKMEKDVDPPSSLSTICNSAESASSVLQIEQLSEIAVYKRRSMREPDVASIRSRAESTCPGTRSSFKEGTSHAVQEEDESSSRLGMEHVEIEDGNQNLKRHLEARHLQMIAIGGTIGTGLFVAGGSTIAEAGPLGALIAYSVVSVMVFFIVTSLGEMAAYIPISGSFNSYAGRFVDPALAFTLGWNYWFQWAISLPSELSALGIIMRYWTSIVPDWTWSAGTLVLLFIINSLGVKSFAETEYVLSLIKIIAVLIFCFLGFLLDFGAFGQEPIFFDNYNIEGAPFKGGIVGIINVILVAFFSFGGTELVGITAGETKNPAKNVPKAIYGTFWRILLFYILSIFVMGLVLPNDDPHLALIPASSDIHNVTIASFTLVLQKIPKFEFSSHIMNGVILTAVLSACNSAMYAASRTLVSMAADGKAPKILGRADSRGVPWPALIMTTMVGSIALFGSFFGNGVVLLWLIRIAGITGIITWLCISVIHLRFRGAIAVQKLNVQMLPYRAPLHPFGSCIAISIGCVILIGQAYVTLQVSIAEFAGSFIGLPVFLVMYISYKILYKTKLIPLEEIDLTYHGPDDLSQYQKNAPLPKQSVISSLDSSLDSSLKTQSENLPPLYPNPNSTEKQVLRTLRFPSDSPQHSPSLDNSSASYYSQTLSADHFLHLPKTKLKHVSQTSSLNTENKSQKEMLQQQNSIEDPHKKPVSLEISSAEPETPPHSSSDAVDSAEFSVMDDLQSIASTSSDDTHYIPRLNTL